VKNVPKGHVETKHNYTALLLGKMENSVPQSILVSSFQ